MKLTSVAPAMALVAALALPAQAEVSSVFPVNITNLNVLQVGDQARVLPNTCQISPKQMADVFKGYIKNVVGGDAQAPLSAQELQLFSGVQTTDPASLIRAVQAKLNAISSKDICPQKTANNNKG